MSLCLNNPNYNKNNSNEERNNFSALKKIKSISKQYLNNKYGTKCNNLKYNYLGAIVEALIYDKKAHIVAVFKDYMILDYVEEFLKRFYFSKESTQRIPKFSKFYKNYLKFFCSPTLREAFSNELIHNRSEKKAEFFYKKNYKNKKRDNESSVHDKGLCEESETSEESEENEQKNDNILFNSVVRKRIGKYSPIRTSMALSENGSKLKKSNSGLLITYSNEKSLFNIVDGLELCKSFIIKKNQKKINKS